MSSTNTSSKQSEGAVIRPPSTTDDDGTPSSSISEDADRLVRLIEDERHLTAYALLESIRARLNTDRPVLPVAPKKGGLLKRKPKVTEAMLAEEREFSEVERLLCSMNDRLEALEARAKMFRKAKQSLQTHDHWTLSQTIFGVTTSFRNEQDNSLSIKMEGELHGCYLFEQVAVLREIDLHYKWAPFCTSSMTIKSLNKLDSVGWFCLGLPQFGLARDGCFRAVGCDNMMEDGQLLLVGQGVRDRPADVPYSEPCLEVEEADVPDPPTRLGSGRLTINFFYASVDILSPTSIRTTIVGNVNPNIPFLPQSLLDFITRKLCGSVLSALQNAAKKAASSPVKNPHARRMRQEESFYKGWLLPKFQGYCRVFNWEMPEVSALNLTDSQMEEEFNYQESGKAEHKTRKVSTLGVPNDSLRSIDDSSIISSVSGATTGTPFSNNLLTNYLRDHEMKTEARKERKVEASRQRVALRLQPKAFNDEELARLAELKRNKEQRMNGQRTPATRLPSIRGITLNDTTPVQSDSMHKIHALNRKTQSGFIIGLVMMMFTLLYADELLGLHATLASDDHDWLMSRAMDIGTLMYLMLCGAIHFIFCEVALVYAFDALEIGMKTGKETKNFYDGNVQVVVACASAGFIVFGIGKAAWSVVLRNAVWYSIMTHKYAWELLRSVSFSDLPLANHVPPVVLTMPLEIITWTLGAAAFITTKMSSVLSGFAWVLHWIVFRSNSLGSFFLFLLGQIASMFPSPLSRLRSYVEHVRHVFENEETVTSWRADAIETCRDMLAYTAVFLLSILILFTVSAKAEQRHFQDSMDFHDPTDSDRLKHSLEDESLSTVKRALSVRAPSVSAETPSQDKQMAQMISVDELREQVHGIDKGTNIGEPIQKTKKKRRLIPKIRLRRRNHLPEARR